MQWSVNRLIARRKASEREGDVQSSLGSFINNARATEMMRREKKEEKRNRKTKTRFFCFFIVACEDCHRA
jgi:hypothetical protein